MTPNGTRWDQIAPDGTTWDQMGPEDHMGPDSRRYQEAPGAKWEFTVYLQWEVEKEQASTATERTCAGQILPRV